MFSKKGNKKSVGNGIPKGVPKNNKSGKSVKGQEKQIKVEPKPKVSSTKESAVLHSMDLGNEVLSLPVYSDAITKRSAIDSFVVDVLRYSSTEDADSFKAYFIGDYSSKSFESYTKGDTSPIDFAAEQNEVINLKRKVI